MGLEVGTFISDLVSSNPVGGTDQKSQGDDHIRLVKAILQATFPNASKAFRFPQILNKSADYPMVVGDDNSLVIVDSTGATRTISLPNIGTIVAGFKTTILKSVAANSVIVDTPGAETINGAASRTLTGQHQTETYEFDGTNWRVIALIDPVPSATETVEGKAELATQTETNTGTDDARIVTPLKLATHLARFDLPRSYLAGLILSNNGVDPTNDIDIAVGEARDGDNTENMVLASALTKRLDASWVVGTNQGGLDTGTIADGTYHVWLIKRSDTGVVDVLFSLSASAPTMPTNYDRKRRIGSILRESAAIASFTQLGDFFRRTLHKLDVNLGGSPGTSGVARTLSVPLGIIVEAQIQVFGDAGTNNQIIYISPLDTTDVAASGANCTIGINSTTGDAGVFRIKTDTSGQIRTRHSVSGAANTFIISTEGWVDLRGRNN